MMNRPIPCPTKIRLLFEYNPEAGSLNWSKSNLVTKCHRGKPALSSKSDQGYLRGNYRGVHLAMHRVAMCLSNGEWPNGQVDHINGDRSDNRICNLRIVDSQQNCRNQKLRKTNATGTMGVYFHKLTGKWTAQIMQSGKRIHLGLFDTKEGAISARKLAEVGYGYHPNHGAR